MSDNDANVIGKGNSIRTITKSSEWNAIEDIFLQEYMDALRTLIDHEDEVARATITAIDIFYSKITLGLRMADKASEQLARKLK